MGRKHGFSFSWKRATGISGMKGKISRKTGIPLTKSGRRQKAGKVAGCLLPTLLFLLVVAAACIHSNRISNQQYDVTYEVQGWTKDARVTYSNADGGTEFWDGPLPWERALQAKQGDFLYLSAHNVGGASEVSVHIKVNGKIRKSAVVRGPGIATADYRCCDF